jgi:thioredoxin reductase (NADPH)
MQETIIPVLIIGSGPAGLTAAIYAARSALKPNVIEGKKPGGQLIGTTYVENWPGEKKILGPTLMQQMREHAESLGTEFIAGNVTQLDATKKPFAVTLDTGTTFHAHAIILAMGAEPKQLNCPGEEHYWGKGVSTCPVCDGPFYKDKKVIVVGGGDSAMEAASFLRNYTDKITIVHILDKLTACQSMQERVLNDSAIKVIYSHTVSAIEGNNATVTGVVITDQKTKATQKVETDGVFITIGLKPNTDFLKTSIELDKWGYIKIHDHTKTSVEGIFAAGDVHDFRYRQAITAAGSGCMASLDVERYLSSLKNK